MKTQRWQDWVMLIFGIWLFFSPFWMTGYVGASSVAAWNSYIFGVLVTAFAWAALATRQRWEEWIELIIGVWLVISPFVLLFYTNEFGAAWNQMVLGVLIGIDALWALSSYAQKRVEA